MQLLRR